MTVQGHCGMTGSCEKRDRHEEICQSLFSPLIEKPEEEQRDDVLESDFDTVTQYESV